MSNKISVRNNGSDGLLALLKEAQSKYGCVSAEFMEELAKSLDMPLNDVYGVTSFYSFLSVKLLGRNIIKICKSLPCYLKNNQVIIDTVQKELGIKPGETTPDGRFSLQLANCMGLCDQPPAMMVNSDAHVDLTPDKILGILGEYK